jgi:hypothetical protein
VKRERLEFLADNPHFTKRFAFYVGRRCQQASIRDVAKELRLGWDTVKTLEMQYMRAQLKRAGTPGRRRSGGSEAAFVEGADELRALALVAIDAERMPEVAPLVGGIGDERALPALHLQQRVANGRAIAADLLDDILSMAKATPFRA